MKPLKSIEFGDVTAHLDGSDPCISATICFDDGRPDARKIVSCGNNISDASIADLRATGVTRILEWLPRYLVEDDDGVTA